MRCENCGQETEGTCSEGGAKWALCPDCFDREINVSDKQKERGCQHDPVRKEGRCSLDHRG